MRKGKWIGLLLPIGIIAYAVSLQHSGSRHKRTSDVYHIAESAEEMRAMPIETTLSDTLSVEQVAILGIDDVAGVRLNRLESNSYAVYFEYNADPSRLIKALGRLPFHRSGKVADTRCRAISDDEFIVLRRGASDNEFNQMQSFWSPDLQREEVYECIKPPFKHTIIVNTKTSSVKHQVVFVG